MSWHCPNWASNIDTELLADDGESYEGTYDTYRCSSFDSNVYVSVDWNDNHTHVGDTDEARCANHDRVAEWEDGWPSDFAETLDSHETCGECELIFPHATALEEHNTTEHDGEEPGETIFIRTPGWSPRPAIPTMHRNWAP
jgi:hypothetical protein